MRENRENNKVHNAYIHSSILVKILHNHSNYSYYQSSLACKHLLVLVCLNGVLSPYNTFDFVNLVRNTNR